MLSTETAACTRRIDDRYQRCGHRGDFWPEFVWDDGTAKAYGAFYEIVASPGENSDAYSVNHSALAYLISPDGKWKLIYNFDQLGDAERL
jgi:hypothetical protein